MSILIDRQLEGGTQTAEQLQDPRVAAHIAEALAVTDSLALAVPVTGI